MTKRKQCADCVEQLLEQNQELWANAIKTLGDSDNTDWCNLCDEWFVQANINNIDKKPEGEFELILEQTPLTEK